MVGAWGRRVPRRGDLGVVNAMLPPVLAALRLPFMVVTGFLLVLVADARRC